MKIKDVNLKSETVILRDNDVNVKAHTSQACALSFSKEKNSMSMLLIGIHIVCHEIICKSIISYDEYKRSLTSRCY